MALRTSTIGPSEPESASPLVLAHGFTQNGRCWGPLDQILGARHLVRLVDLPGHGGSAHDDADLWEAGRLLADAGGEAVYVGYSMGGRIALHTTLDHPSLVRGLVLIGATAGLETDRARRERRSSDLLLAQQLRAVGLEEFLERWLESPLFATLDPDRAHVAARLDNRLDGVAASLLNCGTGTMDPLWDRLPEIEVPVLVLAGEEDERFCALGERLVDGLRHGRFVAVPEAGHSVHLERPLATAELIEEFVAGID